MDVKTLDELSELFEKKVVTQEGDHLGVVTNIYVDEKTEVPTFLGVQTGWFGSKETIVPIELVQESASGDLLVPYTEEFMKSAPTVDPEDGLQPEEEATLYAYYSLDFEALKDVTDGEITVEDGINAKDALIEKANQEALEPDPLDTMK